MNFVCSWPIFVSCKMPQFGDRASTNSLCEIARRLEGAMAHSVRRSIARSIALARSCRCHRGARSRAVRGPRFVLEPRRRSERPARHHRHAARRRAVVVRRPGADAQPRSARRRRRALHVRARARRRHAAVAHVDPERPAALRARHARQQRVPRPARHADAGDAAEGARLRDRRVRRRLSAHQALRADAGLRRLRRPDARDARRDRDVDARAPRRRRGRRARVDVDRHSRPAQFFAWVHVFDPHSPYRPPADLARAIRRAAVPRRGRVRRSRARPAARPAGRRCRGRRSSS